MSRSRAPPNADGDRCRAWSGGAQLSPAIALADPAPDPRPVRPLPAAMGCCTASPTGRADGTSRGAVIAYKIARTSTAISRRCYREARSGSARSWPTRSWRGWSVRRWPYGSNLHCEILVDDEIVAQADQFIAPRFFRSRTTPGRHAAMRSATWDMCRQTAASIGPGHPLGPARAVAPRHQPPDR
jgi:hypothetical protein